MPTLLEWTEPLGEFMNVGATAEAGGLIACLYAGDLARFIEIMGPLNPPLTNVLLFFTTPTNSYVRVAVFTQPGFLFLIIGGTHAWHQWPRHGTGTLSAEYRDPDNNPIPGVGVHGFHQVVARNTWDVAFEVFPDDWESREIRVAGHSLGGAAAHLIAFRLAQMGHGARTQVITFGSPRFILGIYPGPYPAAEYRVTYYDDFVTHIPPPFTNQFIQLGNALWTIRSPREKGTGRSLTERGGLFGATWEHYGPSYQNGDNGLLVISPETHSPRIHDPWHQVAGRTFKNHLMPAYLTRWNRTLQRTFAEPQAYNAIAIGLTAADNPNNPAPPIVADPALGATLEYSNAQLVNPPGGPLTPENAARGQGVYFVSTAIGLSDARDIGKSEVTVSEIFDCTMLVQNDQYQKSNTVSCSATSPEDAIAKMRADPGLSGQEGSLVTLRATLLGSDTVDPAVASFAAPIGKGTPAIEFIRARDAKDPRRGKIDNVPFLVGMPYAATSENKLTNGSDPLWNQLSISIYAGTGADRRLYALHVSGFPDSVVVGGRYNGAVVVGSSGYTFNTLLLRFLRLLTNTATWGISGQDYTAPLNAKKNITAWGVNVTTNQAQATITTHGYVTGERVKISGSGARYYDRTWYVIARDANTIELVGSAVLATQLPPKLGQAIRWADVNGVRQVRFLPFNAVTWRSPIPLTVGRVSPGRRFNKLGFRPSRRKVKGSTSR